MFQPLLTEKKVFKSFHNIFAKAIFMVKSKHFNYYKQNNTVYCQLLEFVSKKGNYG